MNKLKKISLRTVCLVLGCLLIAGALVTVVWWQVSAKIYADRINGYLDTLTKLMPPPQSAVLENRTDNRMPSLSVDGNDFIGILEFQGTGCSLPVGSNWGKSDRFPCRYYGSVYDGSMVVGATNQKGQLTFVKELSVGNTIFFTDMTGSRYCYSVTDIIYCDHANNDVLISESDDLILFIKNIYAFEYIIVKCNAD